MNFDSDHSLWGESTHWSIIRRATASSAGSDRNEAWRQLIERYRRPITVCIRRRVAHHPDAEAIIEGFFGYLFAEHVLAKLDRNRGTFRAFVQGVIRRYVLAACRQFTPSPTVTEQLVSHPAADPEAIDAREEWTWARSILDQAVARLLASQPRDGELLLASVGFPPYRKRSIAELQVSHGLSANAVHVALMRARRRLHQLMEFEIRDMVNTHADYEQEKKALIGRLLELPPNLLGPSTEPGTD